MVVAALKLHEGSRGLEVIIASQRVAQVEASDCAGCQGWKHSEPTRPKMRAPCLILTHGGGCASMPTVDTGLSDESVPPELTSPMSEDRIVRGSEKKLAYLET